MNNDGRHEVREIDTIGGLKPRSPSREATQQDNHVVRGTTAPSRGGNYATKNIYGR
jgi:hypothetical protein